MNIQIKLNFKVWCFGITLDFDIWAIWEIEIGIGPINILIERV